jgi:hypothetical protein
MISARLLKAILVPSNPPQIMSSFPTSSVQVGGDAKIYLATIWRVITINNPMMAIIENTLAIDSSFELKALINFIIFIIITAFP